MVQQMGLNLLKKKKKNLDSFVIAYTKMNLKWILRLLEENRAGSLLDLGLITQVFRCDIKNNSGKNKLTEALQQN